MSTDNGKITRIY